MFPGQAHWPRGTGAGIMISAGEWKRLVKPLLDDASAWEFRSKLCYRVPVKWALQGVLAEGSGFGGGVFVRTVKMPLFVPDDTLNLSYSDRVGGGARKYGLEEPDDLRHAIVSALQQVRSEQEAIVEFASYDKSRNLGAAEVGAYADILSGHLEQARKALSRVAAVDNDPLEWVQEMAARARHILHTLDGGGAADAILQLRAWRNETCDALKIPTGARVGPS
jgi:hypothetical protein